MICLVKVENRLSKPSVAPCDGLISNLGIDPEMGGYFLHSVLGLAIQENLGADTLPHQRNKNDLNLVRRLDSTMLRLEMSRAKSAKFEEGRTF